LFYYCNMLLIADSGSTKCHWALLLPDGNVQRFETMGFNPFFHDADKIATEIQQNDGLNSIANGVTKIAYYGASVSSPERAEIVRNALSRVFTHASFSIDHDMIGSAHATCGTSPGIACIIGTGSNSCYFDGKNISEKVPALGFILGDEGSGTWLGKILLRDFLYHDLPPELEADFISTYQIGKEDIFKSIYSQTGVNVYLASFAKFFGKNRQHDWVQKAVKDGFRTFNRTHVCKFDNYESLPVHYVGSIAFHFKEELAAVGKEMNLQIGNITNEPILGLVNYYKNSMA